MPASLQSAPPSTPPPTAGLFRGGLRDLFEAEHRTLRLFPVIAEAAESPGLQLVIERYLRQCGSRLQRLEMILDAFGERAGGGNTRALEELARIAELAIAMEKRSLWRDVTLLACVQAILQSKLEAVMSLRALAARLEFFEAAEVLHGSVEEETRMDRDLAVLVQQVLARRDAPCRRPPAPVAA
jgi:ferritin-like metal-binding protein YciE